MRIILLTVGLSFASYYLVACSSSGKNQGQGMAEPVGAQTPATSGAGDLPPELRDASTFDPATTLDAETVKQSDFYQVRQKTEADRAAVDAAWKAQEVRDEALRKAREDEERKKRDEKLREEAINEQTRQESIHNYKKTAAQRLRDRQDAERAVKKMPTITHEDVMWNGLED